MSDSQRSPLLNVLAIAALATVLTAAGVLLIGRLLRGDQRLLRDVSFSETRISPNADGEVDVTRISYTLARPADVSIYFEAAGGTRYYFREARARDAGSYSVLFSGVVDGYRLPDEPTDNDIVARLLRNGDYTWVVSATDDDGVTLAVDGALTIEDADSALPWMAGFQIYPQTFTPNRDGVDDRSKIQFDLKKEVATLNVYLLVDGREVPVQELPRDTAANAPGRHVFDYEGGVDLGATPPPDGTYTVIAFAEDAEGQKVRASGELTIALGGVPRAEIVSPVGGADTLQVSTAAVALCDTLYFTATVRNYGAVPIRTTGPAPGAVYDSDWNFNTLGWNTESGAYRFAIGYEDQTYNYPYRWGLGSAGNLTAIGDHLYLMPGQQVVVTGGVRITGALGSRNPQPLWAGLIHEDVEIAQFNDRVDPKAITLDLPADTAGCP